MASNTSATKPPAGNRFARSLRSVRPVEWLVLAATVGVQVWSWLTFVVTAHQDFDAWMLAFCLTSTIGSAAQVAVLLYVRPAGSLRQRLTFDSRLAKFDGAWVVFLAPALLSTLAIAVITPPSTPVAEFDPDMTLYQVIPVTGLLALLFTLLGLGAFGLVVLPLALLVGALLPKRENEVVSQHAMQMSRSQLLFGSGLIIATVGFALSITSVLSTAGSTMRDRMGDQLVGLFSGRGDLLASAATWFFLVSIVVLTIASNRVEAKRRKRDR